MTRVAFIGLGNMGSGMAANQAKAGREVFAFDLSADAMARAKEQGMTPAASAADAVKDADIVITMLPAGSHVRDVYMSTILPNAPKDALLIDCSTIDVDSARTVARDASMQGFRAADAPVSGGTAAATGGTLTFMVGCREQDFAEIEDALKPMSKATIHAGDSGAGQAAKICNNMLLGISMIGVSEAFALAEGLGLDPQKFFDIASKASGQCWSLTSYCPWPGPVPAAPSNRDYEGGFAAAMMLKDLRLAQEAADISGAPTPLGSAAEALYSELVDRGHPNKDFSAILQMLRGRL
ncbi:3-hydroxyisobutyrate dehydrogenase [Terricaulis silvestris]|uniref:3-hydroxyisobutyrate dehydrogenase n=2 Tax=Terricaulis silvestris TaxID=2686094 RepID=A0A6I6MMB8_9CAUL|nr:3-hydroxyisobutyrate dehydrogenase [Terricaulis silvestris]